MTGTTPLAETAGKSFGETLVELFATSFDADAQAGEPAVTSFTTAANKTAANKTAADNTAANEPLPFIKASPDTTAAAVKEIPLPSQTAEQLNTATLPQAPIEILPQQQQPPVLNTPLPAKAAAPDPAPAPDTDFVKSITKKEPQPDAAPAPASTGASPFAKLTKKDTKEKDSNRLKTSGDPSRTAVAVPAFTPLAQNDDPRLLRLSIERASSDGQSAVGSQTVPDAPPAAPEPQGDAHAFQKSPVAFEVTIPKTSSATDQPRPDASSPDYTRSTAPDYTRPAAEPKSILNTVVAPVEKTAAHTDKNQNGKQQPAETPEANAPAPAAAKSTVAAAESVLKPAAPAAPAHDAATVPADAATPYTPAVSGKSTGAPSRLSQSAAVSEPPKIAAPRPHSIDLKVGADTNSPVDVRVSQRAGDVQVTVRTADGNLAQSLRQHLPELSDRLAQNGVSSEMWHPAPAAQTSSDTNSNSQDSRGGGADDANSQRQSRHSNGDAQSDQQEQGRGSAWREQLTTAEKEGL